MNTFDKIMNSVVKNQRKVEYETYKGVLKNITDELTRILDKDDALEIIIYGQTFKGFLEDKNK